ncbi:hypothetical protein [Streptomyces vilmorinianum]|uniref:hypothetical protein n=1 Tax=Streptomyces vilmorinianum TaxID=3051092 RepID=UPI0010FB1C89|nr:hypothetical protein [Streptomyces vilmorinianum]
MPNVPKTPARQIRLPDELWLDFDPAAKSLGTERASIVRELIAWYLREPGAKLPERPSRDVVVAARRRREEEERRRQAESAG